MASLSSEGESLGIAGHGRRLKGSDTIASTEHHELEANEDMNNLSAIHDQSIVEVDVDMSGHDIDMTEDDRASDLDTSANDATVLNSTTFSRNASVNTTTNILNGNQVNANKSILERSLSQATDTSISFTYSNTQGSNSCMLPTPGKRKLNNISMADASYDEHDRLASNNSTQLDISVDQSFGEHDASTTFDYSQERENVPPSSSKRQKSTSRNGKGSLELEPVNEEKIATVASSGLRRTSRRQGVK